MSQHLVFDEPRRRALRNLIATLQHPLEHDDCSAWRRAVIAAVHEVVPVERAGFLLPGADELTTAHDIDSSVHHAYVRDFAALDPAPKRCRELGGAALGQSTVFAGELRRHVVFEDFIRPHGFEGGVLFVGTLPDGETATLFLHDPRLSDPEHERTAAATLDLAYPAFQAGLRAWYSARRGHSPLIDALPDPAALLDGRGRVTAGNAAFHGWLEECRTRGEGETLVRRAREAGEQRQRCGECRCTVRAVPLADDVRLLTIQLPPLHRLDAATVAERFELTPRQADVALLLARGYSDHDIARALVISWHTARGHTEAVLQKLRVKGRAEVSARLLE